MQIVPVYSICSLSQFIYMTNSLVISFSLFCLMPSAAEGRAWAVPTSHLEAPETTQLGARLPQGLWNFPRRWPSSTGQVSGSQSICLFGFLVLLAPLEWPWRTELVPKIRKIRPTVSPMWMERIWNHFYHFCMLTKPPVQSGTLQAFCIFYKQGTSQWQ